MVENIIKVLKAEAMSGGKVSDEYDEILEIEKDYNDGNMEPIVEFFFKKFGTSFSSLLEFCKKKNILPDFSAEKEDSFLDSFIKLSYPLRTGNSRLISSLDEIMLVRKGNNLPEDDKLEPTIKFDYCFGQIRECISIDGENYELHYNALQGCTTVHFCLNQEVLPHKDAPKGWSNCKYIILQPMTEELYQSAVSFEPMDTFFYGDVKLDNYIVVCDGLESAKELMLKNKRAIPLVTSKDKINGFGNKILCCMNIHCPYKIYFGQWHDGTVPITSYYSQDFMKTYPRFITDLEHAVGHPKHDFSDTIRSCYFSLEKFDAIMQILNKNKNRSFEETIKILIDAFKNGKIDNPLDNSFSFAEMLPKKYREYGSFLDALSSEKSKNGVLDIQTVFDEMRSGIEIDNSNVEQFKLMKEFVIKLIDKFNASVKSYEHYQFREIEEAEIFGKVSALLIILKRAMQTDIMKLNVNTKHVYDVPMKWYDLNKTEHQVRQIIDYVLQNGGTLESALEQVYQNIENLDLDFPVEKPLSTNIIDRARENSSSVYEENDDPWLDGYNYIMYRLGLILDSFNTEQHISDKNAMYIKQIIADTVVLEERKKLNLNASHTK